MLFPVRRRFGPSSKSAKTASSSSSLIVVVACCLATASSAFFLGSCRVFQPPAPRTAAFRKAMMYGGNQKAAAVSAGRRRKFQPAAAAGTAGVEEGTTRTPPPSADAEAGEEGRPSRQRQQRRALGSQELLMLPRQYGPLLAKEEGGGGDNDKRPFPQMNHVSCHVLSSTPSVAALRDAVEDALRAHPLLDSRVEGDGEPSERVDLFQMVRSGNPNPMTFVSGGDGGDLAFDADDVLKVVDVDCADGSSSPSDCRDKLDESWQASFQRNLDDGSWCDPSKGPLWKLELHRIRGANCSGAGVDDSGSIDTPCAIVLAFNHAISDQSSANRLVDQILREVAETEAGGGGAAAAGFARAVRRDMPVAVEDSVMGSKSRWEDAGAGGVSAGTIKYVAGKAAEGLKDPVILPDRSCTGDDDDVSSSGSSNALGALSIISGRAAGGKDRESDARESIVQFRTLPKDVVSALLAECRANGVSISNALTAAITLTASDFVAGKEKKRRNYKVLQSLDMRRFGKQLDSGDTVACMAGSMDLMHGPIPDQSGEGLRQNPTQDRLDKFWDLAKEGKRQTEEFVDSDGPVHAVRVFDFAMTISDLNNLVHLSAQSKDTKGRAYSAGSTNVGVYENQAAFLVDGETCPRKLKAQHGRYKVEDVFYATTHKMSGCLYPVSCLTVNDEMKFTFNPVKPIVDEETNRRFADALLDLLQSVATKKAAISSSTLSADDSSSGGILSSIPENALTIAAAALGSAAVLSHAGAYIDFFSSIMEMKQNVPDADFWPALNFWIFFAVGHPILQPILWLSDLLHGSPGPKVADLVPVTFLLANALVIGAVTVWKELRAALNIALVTAFFAYIGAGLDGEAGMGDFNLALDDSYKGQVVKGCPAYEEVRQPSMNDFNLKKYQGKWYEQKFHDWTQFKEVYDTTLSIKLTDDGLGWVDDFAVKGPAPDAAKLSWEKSPVANGAHYFLFGRVDPKDPPGILREKGFGVEFPNYIVDVQKDPKTGEYTEAIQFQCLDRGGVRVFEGINFMSRSPTMTDEQMAAMHARAEKAGMFPYGASPEQMHTVARKLDDEPIDNSWQAMWRAIGLDRLLELLTESIEDGGRS